MSEVTTRLRAEFILDETKAVQASERLRASMERTAQVAERLAGSLRGVSAAELSAGASAAARVERPRATDWRETPNRPNWDRPRSPPPLPSVPDWRANPDRANWDRPRVSPGEPREVYRARVLWSTEADGAASRAVRATRGMSSGFSGLVGSLSNVGSRIGSTVSAIGSLGSRIGSVVAGLAVFGGAAYAAVEAIKAISNAFSRSQDTVDAYGKALDGLPDKLRSIADMNRDFWTERLGLDKLPGFSEREKRRQQLEVLLGTPNTADAPGTEGEHSKLEDRRKAIEGFVLMQQKRARAAGLEVDAAGRILEPAPFDSKAERGPDRWVRQSLERRKIVGERFTTSDGQVLPNYEEALTDLNRIETSQKRIGDTVTQIRRDQVASAAGKALGYALAPEDIAARRTAFAVVNELTPKVRDIFSPTNILAVVKQQQQAAADAKTLAKGLTTGKFPIDARGSRIVVNTEVKTDDPSRFADVAIKSAFVAAAARPLSATLAFGGPMVGGSKP